MFDSKYKSILEQPEEKRHKLALGLSTALTILIIFSWAFSKGILSLRSPNTTVAEKDDSSQVANVISAEKAESPFQSTKETFESAFKQIESQYNEFKESVMSVMVPFVTGIEVYERK